MGNIIKFCYLIKVDSMNNNNKYYQMAQVSGEPYFTAEYGRIGSSGIKRKFPIELWDKKMSDKLEKGYQERTDYVLLKFEESEKYKEISDENVRFLVSRLRKWSNQIIETEFTISLDAVTEKMIKDAQQLIFQLNEKMNLTEFNNTLMELFTILPRKIEGKVSEKMAQKEEEFFSIIEREQELLDIMKCERNIRKSSKKDSNLTILESLGLEIIPVNEKEEKEILSHLGDSQLHYKKAYKITNYKTENRFYEYCESEKISNIKFLYHGSRNENFWNILSTGLLLNPVAVITGKMFGNGLYFANKAKKSLNYTSLEGAYWSKGVSDTGFLAVFKVAVGEPCHVDIWNDNMLELNEQKLKKMNKNSVFAHKGFSLKNDEIIVYNEAAATIKYLIEMEA